MADAKITALTDLGASVVGGDTAVIVDATDTTTKKTSVTNLVTAGLADDVVTAAKMINGQILKRQGGSSTVWATTGTTDYDVSATDVKVQCGTIAAGASPQAVTFGTAFTYAPVVICQVVAVTANCYCTTSSILNNSFSVQVLTDAGAGNNSQYVHWLAIGV